MFDQLYKACKSADKKEVLSLIEKGANDWNDGLQGACQGGNMELVELMISKGANDWNWGLQGACQGGNMELVELMISKGATNISERIIYPKDKEEIIKLLELGISRKQLKKINKIDELYNELDEYNKEILKMTEEVIIT